MAGKAHFSFNTLFMIFAMVVIVAALTWIIPGGEYQRQEVEGKTLVIANSFTAVESRPQGIGAVLMAPLLGFMAAAKIIGFCFIIGGIFTIIQNTGAITAGVNWMAWYFSHKPQMQKFFIPATMTIFSVAGTTFGMCEETMLFVPLFMMLAISLGYDSLVGTAIPFLGAAAGFAGAVINPFTLGIAQEIAQLQPISGWEYRLFIWFLSTLFMIIFVMRYAARVKARPELSPVYEIDRKRGLKLEHGSGPVRMERRHIWVLLAFLLALAGLVFGVIEYKWGIVEMSALFLGLGLAAGAVGGLSIGEIT